MRIKRNIADEEIPTSSMADIAFLLIIYFMVTTTFAATRGIDFSLPQDEDTPLVDKEESVLIEIQPGGVLLVDNKTMQLEDVLEYLKPKLKRNPMKPVIIRAGELTEYGYMVGVFDEIRQAPDKIGMEIKNVSIPTQREINMFWY